MEKSFLLKLLGSFDTSNQGLSGRKLSAFNCFAMSNIISLIACKICYDAKDAQLLLWFVISYFVTGLICLGMVTIPQLLTALKTIKGSNSDEPKEENQN